MSARATPHGKADGTVGKALDVLDSVAAFGRPVKFSELLETSPYPKATLYRLLQTLRVPAGGGGGLSQSPVDLVARGGRPADRHTAGGTVFSAGLSD